MRHALLLLLLTLFAKAQTLHVQDAVRSYATLSNTVVTLAGRSELRITGPTDPLPGCVIHLASPDAWLLMTAVAPSRVASSFVSRVRVNGASAVLDANVRVVQYANGAVIIPHGPEFAPLEVFGRRNFTGPSRRFHSFVEYNTASLGSVSGAIGSFKLKRGYMATLAEQEAGNGSSRCYVAQDGDLEVGLLPSALENNIRFIRVFPWRWTAKKGIAGDIESGLNVSWLYNWNISRNSTLDWEYTPIRQTRWWPGLGQDWKTRGSTHLLGYNEPDRPDQANMTVGDAVWSWPDLLGTGLRVGGPAVSDGGLGWLYDFIAQADAAGLRVDFVPVHYYRCYGNVGDPNGTATQFYNFLKGIYDVVKRPLWVTEWNNGANWTSCADPTFAQQEAAVQAMIDMLENTPFVERYAFYNWVEDARRLKWDDGSLTAAGTRYRDKLSSLAYRQEMPDAGTGSSACYDFDGNTHDALGNGQDAMRVGVPFFTAGKHGQSVALNGATDYLQVSPRLGDTADWSFAGWVLWNGGGNWQRIFDLGEDTSHFLFLTPRSSAGTLRFGIQNGGSQQQLNAPALPVGVWTHVAVTIAGNTGMLFVNSLPVATNTAMTINPVDVGTKYNYLGKSRFSADPLFGGRFDDFRFISSALTDAQIAAIVNTPPPQFNSASLHKPDAMIGQPYEGSIATDASGVGPLAFSKMDGPGWLTVAPSGTITGTPGFTDGGINTFLVRVTDTNGWLHTARLLITVPAITVALTSSPDDAEQSASGSVNITSTDLELVNDEGTGSGNQLVGLRFADLSIPRGAVITNATIQFTADETQSEPASLNIFTQTSDDAAPFTTTANNISSRPRSLFSVPWQPAPWSLGESEAAQRTPNLAALVQEITSRAGWSPGNALVFIISGGGRRTADSSDEPAGSPPHLSVSYLSPTPTHSITAAVNSGANDAEEAISGTVDLTSTDLELVNDTAAGDQVIGLRFENIFLPSQARIASANIQFTADEAQAESTILTLRAQAADNAPIFLATPGDLSSRPLTTASIGWSPDPWNSAGERGPLQHTPDLAVLIREVIARPGWSPGNALAFLLSGAGHRTADSADKLSGLPATLNITYSQELPLGTYARWAAAHNLDSPNADPDNDGYLNLLEYALGLDPSVPDRGAVRVRVNGPALELTYTRPAAVTDVLYQLEWSGTLHSAVWSTAPANQQIIADDGVHRVIRAVLPRTLASTRFVRLKVTLL